MAVDKPQSDTAKTGFTFIIVQVIQVHPDCDGCGQTSVRYSKDRTHLHHCIGKYKYTLTVTAVDKPQSDTAKTGLTFITVQVLPENEFPPVWSSPTPDSKDEFLPFVYRHVTGVTREQVSSCVVLTNPKQCYQRTSFLLCGPHQPQTVTTCFYVLFLVLLQVLPENEFSPVWSSPTPDSNDEFSPLTISELTPPGSNVTQFTATDDDHGKHGYVSYKILSQVSATGSSTNMFTIDEQSGILRVAATLDADSATGGVGYYNVSIVAFDDGTTPLSTTGAITIRLENVNDNSPVLTNHQDTLDVAEDTVVGTVIHTVTATDHDGDNISLSVVGGDLDYFTGNGDQIKTLKTLDYETRQCYTIVISMTDGSFTENVTLSIAVTDVNDESPVLHVYDPLTVPEELPVGSVTGTSFYATDADKDDVLVYTLSGQDMSYIDLNSTTGLLSVKKRIDYEGSSALSSLKVTVTVRDQGGLTDSADLIFTVLDVNDNFPTFTQSVYTVNITEETAISGELLKLDCSDADSGNNGQFSLSVTSGDPGNIFSTSGNDLFANGTQIDYEALVDQDYRFTLTVEAVDTPDAGSARTGVTLVIVQVVPRNEFPPAWSSPITDSNSEFPPLNVSEDSLPGSMVTEFTATDDDHGIHGTVSYKIISQVSDTGSSANMFRIDEQSGVLRVAATLDADSATGGVDYYNLTIVAFDDGTTPLSTTGAITIRLENVNDNAPVLTNHQDTLDVAEDTVVGTIIHTVTATDHDGDNITLSVVGGDLDYFTGDGDQIKTLKTLDYETRQCYTVVISISDGTFSENLTISISVTNVNDERPVLHVYDPLAIPEELPVGTVTGIAFYATDADNNDTLVYTLNGQDINYFDLNMTTGLLSVKQRIDHEGSSAVSSLKVTITVRDQGGLTDSADLIFTVLDVNDNFPTFSQSVYTVNITEETAISGKLLQLDCSDADSGNNGKFTLSVTSGDPSNIFTTSGNDLFADGTQIDYEALVDQDYRFTLTVEAVDNPDTGPARSGVTLVIVQVVPLNEFAPEWTQPSFDTSSETFATQTINEDIAVGINITTLEAEDKDLGEDGVVVYNIMSTVDNDGKSAKDVFVMDATSGTLRVSSVLDSDVETGGVQYYNITVVATDSGSSEKSVTGTFQITIENTNDNAPFLEDFEPTVAVSEDTSMGSVVHTLTAVDYDGDTVTVTVVGGDTAYFTTSGNNIRLDKQLDYEKQQCHTVIISLSDGKYTQNWTLTVVVTNINENPSIHVRTPLAIAEELPIGTVVGGAFYANDEDAEDSHTYTLSGQDISYFELNTTTGMLSVKKRIDHEGSSAVSSLKVTVTVRDQGGLTDSADLIFTVLDVNDNFPTFSQSVYTVNVTEQTVVTGKLLQLDCSDADSGNNGQFSLSVTSGDPSNIFSTSGNDLFANGTQTDYEALVDQDYRFTLTVEAVDTPDTGPARTGVTLVIVQVVSLNEFAPVWTSPSFDTSSGRFPDQSIREDLTPGSNITTLTANDDDHGADGDVKYQILSTTDSTGKNTDDAFMIGLYTGTLRLATPLDSDTATGGVDNFTVVVVAVDSGHQQRSVTGSIIIHLEDVNDNAPTLRGFQSNIDVSEAKAVGDVVVTLTMVDDDDGDSVMVTIVDGDEEFFTVDINQIKLKNQLDFESAQCHSLVINVSDGKHEDNVTFTFHVIDINDNSPILTVDSPVRLSEEHSVGSVICGVFSVTDADANDTLTFSLSGSQANNFDINSTSGVLTVNDVIDRDGASGISTISDVMLTVTDAAGHSVNKTLTFEIEDINDNPPVFSQWIYVVNATEGKTVADPLLTFGITDADSGSNAKVTVYISDGDEVNPKFNISGQQLYVNSNTLDYEALNNQEYHYFLSITAKDNPQKGKPRSNFALVIVKILPQNEFVPVWMSPVPDTAGLFPNVTIRENVSVGSVIATFTATDEDHGDDGIVEYSIMSVISDSGKNVSTKFQIDDNTGILRSADDLDRDTPTGGVMFYDVTITARDRGEPIKETQGTIRVHLENVNDNEPQFLVGVASINVTESAAVGQIIYSITATDDDGDSLVYSASDSDRLKTDGADVKIVKQFDYETDKFMLFTLTALDSDHEVNMTLFVTVEDEPDETPRLEAGGVKWISEEMPVGTVVCGLFSMTDADASDEHVYKLHGSDKKYFNINTTTGEITMAERINRDGATGVTSLTDLKLTVTDSSGLEDSIYLNITIQDVNDNPPVFSEAIYHANVTENMAPNSSVLTFSLTDIDDGPNGQFNLSIDGDSGLFKIDGLELLTGPHTVGDESLAENDYKVILKVIAVDKPERGDVKTATAIVILEILLVNEESPVWKNPTVDSNGSFPNLRISEDISPGSNISTFKATDDDMGVDGVVTYYLMSVTTNTGSAVQDIFLIDLESGVLRTRANLDRDDATGGVEYYDVVLEARDSNELPRTSKGTVRILLDNVNDNLPVIDCLYVLHILMPTKTQ
ncbi:cadherin-23-like [Gigantopelta aegis]|uniref:cadherin-23-like n=1 Tax=Gigantopelta aegis TaxID=1735272 RepID=UPI001B88CE37|nr:cadherin-23-like [Gigantopelta aegis]